MADNYSRWAMPLLDTPLAKDLLKQMRFRCIGPFRGGRVVAVAGRSGETEHLLLRRRRRRRLEDRRRRHLLAQRLRRLLRTSSVGALAVAASDSNVIYAGTGETTIRIDVSHGDGVYQSTDAGRTWTHVGLRDTRHIGKIRVHPNNPDLVWVAALGHAFGPNEERGVFKSTDGGKTWRNVLFVSDKAGAVDLSVDESNPRILYATIWEAYRSFWQISSGGPDSGLWQVDRRRRDLGGHHRANQGLPQTASSGKIGVAASPAKAGRVWALIEHATEGGSTAPTTTARPGRRSATDQNLVSRAWYYIHLTADPQDADTVYVNNLDFWKSTDGGKTFTSIATPHGDNHDLWIDPRDNQRMIQGNDGGANVSFNGGDSWSTIYNQPTAQFYHLATDTEEPYTTSTAPSRTTPASPSPAGVNHAAITWGDCYPPAPARAATSPSIPTIPTSSTSARSARSPGGGNALQRYDRRTDQIRLITTWPECMGGYRRRRAQVPLRLDLPDRLLPARPRHALHRRQPRLQEHRRGPELGADQPRPDPRRPGDARTDRRPDQPRRDRRRDLRHRLRLRRVAPRGRASSGPASDDGLVHLSRDGGETWEDVTPPDLPGVDLISGDRALAVRPRHRLRGRAPATSSTTTRPTSSSPATTADLDPDRRPRHRLPPTTSPASSAPTRPARAALRRHRDRASTSRSTTAPPGSASSQPAGDARSTTCWSRGAT